MGPRQGAEEAVLPLVVPKEELASQAGLEVRQEEQVEHQAQEALAVRLELVAVRVPS